MAFGVKQIYPIDKQVNVALGISIPLQGPTGFNSTYLTKDAIRNNLLNFLLTEQGERFLNPSLGGGLRKYIFSQIDEGDLSNLKEDLQARITIAFPSVEIKSLDVLRVNVNESDNTIQVVMKYAIAHTADVNELKVQFG